MTSRPAAEPDVNDNGGNDSESDHQEHSPTYRVLPVFQWECDDCDEGESSFLERTNAEAGLKKHLEEKHVA